MCSMAYMCMVTAFMQIREEKMTMFTIRAHDKVTRIILAGTVSCVNSIQAEQENGNSLVYGIYVVEISAYMLKYQHC